MSSSVLYDAVILSGGTARRLGGLDKSTVSLGGRRLLDHVLDACSGARATVVVGPAHPTSRAVTWTVEDPPRSGPAAGLAAGLAALGHDPSPWVLVLATDMPWAGQAVPRLMAALSGLTNGSVDGVQAMDEEERAQPLLALYAQSALRAALTNQGVGARATSIRGPSLRSVLSPLSIATVRITGQSTQDIDTWDDVEKVGAVVPSINRNTTGENMSRTVPTLEQWCELLSSELGLTDEVAQHPDIPALLDMTREAAHNIARPAAPLTSYLVGMAAARHGGTAEAFESAAATAQEVARRFAPQEG